MAVAELRALGTGVRPTCQQLRCVGVGCRRTLSEATAGVTVSSQQPIGVEYEKRICRICKTVNYVTLAR